MMRALVIVLLGASLSGCGLVLDGAYLLSGKRYSKEEKVSRRTELAQVAFEHEVRASQGQLWLACEDVERGVDRVWTVRKEYEYQGGFHQVHWLPVILDTLIAGGLSIAFGTNCAQKGELCTALWGTVPLWADDVYSVIRLLTIDPPKLVGKTRGEPTSEPSPTPNSRRTVSCEPDATLVIGSSAVDPLASWFRVDAWGAVQPQDRARLLTALQRTDAHVMWSAGGREPQGTSLSRCDALAGLGTPCPPPPPSR